MREEGKKSVGVKFGVMLDVILPTVRRGYLGYVRYSSN